MTFDFFSLNFFFFTFLSQHRSCLHTREFFILICSQSVMQYHQISVTYYGIFFELIVSLKSLCLPHEIFTDFRVSSCNEQFSSLGIFFDVRSRNWPRIYRTFNDLSCQIEKCRNDVLMLRHTQNRFSQSNTLFCVLTLPKIAAYIETLNSTFR